MIKNNKQYESAFNTKPLERLASRSKGLAPLNLSKAKRHFFLIDTETIGDIKKGEKAFPYDVSFLKVFKRKIVDKMALINTDIFDNEYQMSNAFYKNKIPFYKHELETNELYQRKNDIDILVLLNKIIKQDKIKYFLAYNVRFDYESINNLYELKGKNIPNEFKKLYLVDIWKIATDIIIMFPELYKSFMLFCFENRLFTESGANVQTGAECMNKFVNNDINFIENHTGLEDTYCELNILLKMLWYYEKHTGLDYYYKLDSINNGHGKHFRGGAFNIDKLAQFIPNYETLLNN